MEIGNQNMEIGKWKLKMEIGSWKMEIGNAKWHGTYRPRYILKGNSVLTFSFKLFPFLVTSMSKTYKKE